MRAIFSAGFTPSTPIRDLFCSFIDGRQSTFTKISSTSREVSKMLDTPRTDPAIERSYSSMALIHLFRNEAINVASLNNNDASCTTLPRRRT